MLPPICDRSCFTDRGDIWGVTSNRYRFAFHYGEFSFSAYDKCRSLGIYWVNNPKELPYWSYAAPLRTILHWCMEQSGQQLLHAAAIGTDDGAILLTGEGGIGKSTTALIGLDNNMKFAGDDYVVVGLDPIPTVYPLYSSAKVNQFSEIQFEHLKAYQTNRARDDEKKVFQLYPDYKSQIPESMPLAAIFVPKIVDGETSAIKPDITRGDVVRKASFTTVSQLPYSGKYTYEFIEILSKLLPGYYLEVGSSRNNIAQTISNFIAVDPKPKIKTEKGSKQKTILPSLSVIIPVYNRENTIKEALDNVVSQKYPDMDLIVINDGSTDKTEETIKSHHFDIRYFSQNNLGPSQARNRGIVNTRSDYIAFLDSDDLWPKGMLVHLVESLIADQNADVVKGYCQLARMDSTTNSFEYEGSPLDTFPNYITGTVFRKQAFDKVGLFDKELRFGEDNDWFIRAQEKSLIIKRLKCTSVIVRRHDNNMTRNKDMNELNVVRVIKKSLDRKRQQIHED